MFSRDFLTRGFTLIEMMVVISVFSIVAVLVGNMVGHSMKGVRKSESSLKVRAELENAVSIVERSLRGAKANSVTCYPKKVILTDQDDQEVTFSCSGSSPNIILNKGVDNIIDNIIGSNIKLDGCNFNCSGLDNGVIFFTLSGSSSVSSSGVESDSVSVSARVVLRNY